ncbi:MAG: response regulator [Magnetococcales bacterium]|nr:response regulator [Magnetococcales bacterium]
MALKILVADDEDDAWTLMQELLKKFGEVDRVANGHEAVAAFILSALDGEPYDLVFLDIMMPGIDGYETVSRMRSAEREQGVKQNERAVIIMTSALFSRENQATAMAQGASDYIVKPIIRSKLYAIIRNYFPETGGDEPSVADDKRKFDRPLFHSRAELILKSGIVITGRTKDVSFNGILFQSDQDASVLQPHVEGLLRIALSDAQEVAAFHAAFPCKVVRINEQGIALKMSAAAARTFADAATAPKPVAVHRTGGKVDPGWEILDFNHTIPDDVLQKLQRKIAKMSQDGPVVVCCKKGTANDEELYKVVNIRHLKEIQKLAPSS